MHTVKSRVPGMADVERIPYDEFSLFHENAEEFGLPYNGPESFADFDEILARTIEFNPTRSVSSLRRGILHNAVQREDGSWVWRYQRFRAFEPETGADSGSVPDFSALWDAVGRIAVPLMLVRGMLPQSVVDDEDEGERIRRQPEARVERVEDAGHSVQGDQPVVLARLIVDFTSGIRG